jgi:hypothetical protein
MVAPFDTLMPSIAAGVVRARTKRRMTAMKVVRRVDLALRMALSICPVTEP